jgi:release factor glutamine methyltransferase
VPPTENRRVPDESIAALLREGAQQLAASGEAARLEAELLLGEVLGRPRSFLFAFPEQVPDANSAGRYRALIAARAAGRPVAQLLGRRDFWSLALAVDEHTLIPRPETELLVEAALARLPPDRAAHAADLGTGSGAIALAIASERPLLELVATDASAAALAVAQRNAQALGLASRVVFRLGDWLAPLAGERFDLIASNPPYLAEDDPHLKQGDLRFEPRSALASGTDGLDAIRRIVADAPAHLRPGGWLLLEHGLEQGAAIRALLEAAGFAAVRTLRDLEDRDRVSLGQLASP